MGRAGCAPLSGDATGMTKKGKHCGGFTLIELMVTISMASILMAISVPSFSRMMTNSRITTQTNELISVISFTRSEAISKNMSLDLCRAADATTSNCAEATGAWEHWIIRDIDGDVVRRGVIKTYDNTLLVESTLEDDLIRFGSDGLALTGDSLVNAEDDEAHYLRICSDNHAVDNIRTVFLGAGSRVTTIKESGSC